MIGRSEKCTVISNQPVSDELAAAIVKALDLSPMRMTLETLRRVRGLRACASNFVMALWLRLPDSNERRCVLLRVPRVELRPEDPYGFGVGAKVRIRAVDISEAQARRIIEHLLTDGFLERGLSFHHDGRMDVVEGPAAVWAVGIAHYWPRGNVAENLGWGLPMLQRLKGLREVLDGEAAKAADQMLIQLKPLRKQ